MRTLAARSMTIRKRERKDLSCATPGSLTTVNRVLKHLQLSSSHHLLQKKLNDIYRHAQTVVEASASALEMRKLFQQTLQVRQHRNLMCCGWRSTTWHTMKQSQGDNPKYAYPHTGELAHV